MAQSGRHPYRPTSAVAFAGDQWVRYATAYDREILDVFTSIRHHTDLEHAGRLLTREYQRHLRDAREMTE